MHCLYFLLFFVFSYLFEVVTIYFILDFYSTPPVYQKGIIYFWKFDNLSLYILILTMTFHSKRILEFFTLSHWLFPLLCFLLINWNHFSPDNHIENFQKYFLIISNAIIEATNLIIVVVYEYYVLHFLDNGAVHFCTFSTSILKFCKKSIF